MRGHMCDLRAHAQSPHLIADSMRFLRSETRVTTDITIKKIMYGRWRKKEISVLTNIFAVLCNSIAEPC